MPDYSKKIVYLTQAQYQELITNETITVNGVTVNYNDNDIYVTPQAEPITDVKINGTSIGSNGVANVPMASASVLGVVKSNGDNGTGISAGGVMYVATAYDSHIKAGTQAYRPIVPQNQHQSVFYGLAKVAGHDEKNSTEALGTYTPEAKGAIQNMLGITDLIASSEASTATATHAANSLFMMDGKLMRATTAVVIGDAVEVGTNCEVTNISEEFATNVNLNLKADKASPIFTGSISLGRKTNSTIGISSLAVGTDNIASGSRSIAMGNDNTSSGIASYSVGSSNIASGNNAVAEGNGTQATGHQSHAEGIYTQATAQDAHAEGYDTRAYGAFSHAEGCGTIARGNGSHVMGCYNVEDLWQSWDEWTANTSYSIGDKVKVTTTTNNSTTVQGYECTTANNDATFTITNWKTNNLRQYIEILGNGTNASHPSNGRVMDWSGNERLNGYLYVGCNADSTGGVRVPHDVQVNETSVVSNGVANIPLASSSTAGVVQFGSAFTINSGKMVLANPSAGEYKTSGTSVKAVTPSMQHYTAFYGLAKAAGDTTQSASSNAVGTYTDSAKLAIQTMLGIDLQSIASEVEIPLIETVTGTTPSITGQPNTRYICGEISTLSITPPASGSVDVIFESGSTATVLTVPNTVKWPSWFDATALETDTTYEILITDGIYGSVMTWAT